MKNIFESLYYGDIRPSDIIFPESEEIVDARAKVADLSVEIVDHLSKVMTPKEAVELFREYELLDSEIVNYEKSYLFEYGFKLAYKIHMQAILDEAMEEVC